jgi:putative ABC transport system ATP-binding protein
VIELRAVERAYDADESRVDAIRGIDLSIEKGEFVAIIGPSGSGKSTLLNVMGALDQPTAGDVELCGRSLSTLSRTELARIRSTTVGFVFQAFNLVPALNVRENVLLPSRLARRPVDRRWVAEMLRRVGLDGRLRHRPAQLSGGQQQRVAIARALAVRPEVIFCDEPTGALDSQTAAGVLDLLRDAVDHDGQTVVMVTHDPIAASYADRVVFLADGVVVHDTPAPGVTAIAEMLAQPW